MLSVIFLTKNDEEVIEAGLASVKDLADELIVVDSGSTDRTVEIARKKGAKIIEHVFRNFADQRNFAIEKAYGDWVLFLDSDEQATPAFVSEVKSALNNFDQGSDIGGYFIARKTFYFDKDWGMVDHVQRLFRRNKFIEWKGVVHETPVIKGTFEHITEPVLHFTHRNLSQMLSKTNMWSEYEADLRLRVRHPVMTPLRFIRVMATGFLHSYVGDHGYKNGTEGVIEAVYQAFSMFVTYAKLWEKQQEMNKD